MRIFFIVIAILTAFIGTILAILPFGTIAILPGSCAIIAGLIAYFLSRKHLKPKKLPLLFVLIGALIVITSSLKMFLIKDTVAPDKEFQKKEQQKKEEAIEELKEIENELKEVEDDREAL